MAPITIAQNFQQISGVLINHSVKIRYVMIQTPFQQNQIPFAIYSTAIHLQQIKSLGRIKIIALLQSVLAIRHRIQHAKLQFVQTQEKIISYCLNVHITTSIIHILRIYPTRKNNTFVNNFNNQFDYNSLKHTNNSSNDNKGWNTGAIVGITLGSCIIIFVMLGTFGFFCLKDRLQHQLKPLNSQVHGKQHILKSKASVNYTKDKEIQHDSLNSNNPTIHLNAINKYILVILLQPSKNNIYFNNSCIFLWLIIFQFINMAFIFVSNLSDSASSFMQQLQCIYYV
ncbi:Hypothetical_protein [Hexamita inflata]|uniref:Hypothetical_protein n=1 Tax=Hexamita inflata TaxID=28002 RepID=A0AA86NWK4_9EUKA|nr:Hypothetical protein HINF_LOCUS14601 [Hexamita inflata]